MDQAAGDPNQDEARYVVNPPDRVSALWRYPVKSMLGEALATARVSRHGLEGDRSFAVVDTNGRPGFVENDWVGRTLAIGGVRLEVTEPCPRCVMTTLPQGELPRDPGILKAIVRHNQANVGVYARVLRGGVVARGQAVEVEGRVAAAWTLGGEGAS